jgi:hypothetical protein
MIVIITIIFMMMMLMMTMIMRQWSEDEDDDVDNDADFYRYDDADDDDEDDDDDDDRDTIIVLDYVDRYHTAAYALRYPDRVEQVVLCDPWGMPTHEESGPCLSILLLLSIMFIILWFYIQCLFVNCVGFAS